MDGPQSDLPAVAGLPVQRAPGEPAGSADVLRSLGLDALVELVEGSAHGVGVTGEDGRWLYLNPAGCRLVGRSFEQVCGEDLALHVPERELAPAAVRLVVLLPPAGTAPSETELVRSAPGAHASVAPADEELRRQAGRAAAEQERRRLSRDLHDSVSSALFALHTRTQVVDRALAAGDTALLAEAAKDMQALSGQAIAELRAMVSAMREDVPTQDRDGALDLPAAFERLAATTRSRDGLAVQLRLAQPLPPVPLGTAEHLVRIAAEAVHNCVKHAAAAEVRVQLDVRGSELVLVVQDEGRGFDASAVDGAGHGQRTMRERAVLCGGWLHVDTAPGQGTRVVVRLPLPG